MGSDYSFVAFTNYRIAFLVTDPGFTNDSWAFFNANTVSDAHSAVLFAVTFTPLFMTTQVLV
jgi:hypothetical protein